MSNKHACPNCKSHHVINTPVTAWRGNSLDETEIANGYWFCRRCWSKYHVSALLDRAHLMAAQEGAVLDTLRDIEDGSLRDYRAIARRLHGCAHFMYPKQVRNALLRLERRGAVYSEVVARGWYKRKVYQVRGD